MQREVATILKRSRALCSVCAVLRDKASHLAASSKIYFGRSLARSAVEGDGANPQLEELELVASFLTLEGINLSGVEIYLERLNAIERAIADLSELVDEADRSDRENALLALVKVHEKPANDNCSAGGGDEDSANEDVGRISISDDISNNLEDLRYGAALTPEAFVEKCKLIADSAKKLHGAYIVLFDGIVDVLVVHAEAAGA